MTATFDEIRQKLADLRGLDKDRAVFASDRHQYRLNPPLTLKTLETIEQQLGVQLPEQYRRFVLEFADGGAGPEYGVHSLLWVLERSRESQGIKQSLAEPFPAPRTLKAMRALGYSPPGTLPVGDIGCGGYYALVLSGPDRGFVWICNPDMEWSPELSDESHLKGIDNINSILRAAIRSPDELKLQFIDWYVKWLEHSLRQVKARNTKGRADRRGGESNCW